MSRDVCLGADAGLRVEDLPVAFDQRHEGRWGAKQPRRELHDPVIGRFTGDLVETVALQRGETRILVGFNGGTTHERLLYR